jgi:hypothetical protein
MTVSDVLKMAGLKRPSLAGFARPLTARKESVFRLV